MDKFLSFRWREKFDKIVRRNMMKLKTEISELGIDGSLFFVKICQRISISFHLSHDLLDRITHQHNEVHHQEWPEHINLNLLKKGANDPQNKGKANPLPYLQLTDRRHQWLLLISPQIFPLKIWDD